MKLHKFSIAVDAQLLAKARHAVSITPGITLASIARNGLVREIRRMARHNKKMTRYDVPVVVLSPGRPRKT